jgi:acetylornithine deacetylase/succinyl-diaminopimelate desuccinylase-like protein
MQDIADLINEKRLLRLTQTLVEIPSVTGKEHALSDWVFDYLSSLGMDEVKRLPVEDAGDTIVSWLDGPREGPGMLLLFHLDTFDVCDGWDSDPFKAVRDGNRLYGLGIHDMKAGGACILGALEAIVQSGADLGGRLYTVATTDEENWSRGAHEVISSGLLADCSCGLNPEPTARREVRIGQRGRHVFHLTLKGKTIQASYDHDEGINAVVDAAKLVSALDQVPPQALGVNETYNIRGNLAVTSIQGGSTMILIPERAHVYLECHTIPGQTAETEAELLKKIIEQSQIKSTVEIEWDDRPTPAPTAYLVSEDAAIVREIDRQIQAEFNQPPDFVIGRSVNDASHFTVYGGIPTLLYGPQGGNTCKANEYLAVDSLVPTTRIYLNTVLNILGANQRPPAELGV